MKAQFASTECGSMNTNSISSSRSACSLRWCQLGLLSDAGLESRSEMGGNEYGRAASIV